MNETYKKEIFINGKKRAEVIYKENWKLKILRSGKHSQHILTARFGIDLPEKVWRAAETLPDLTPKRREVLKAISTELEKL